MLKKFLLFVIDGGEIDRFITFLEGHRELITLILRLILIRLGITGQQILNIVQEVISA